MKTCSGCQNTHDGAVQACDCGHNSATDANKDQGKCRGLILKVGLGIVMVLVPILFLWGVKSCQEARRLAERRKAIERIREFYNNNEWRRQHFEHVNNKDVWLTKEFMQMKNGDWLIYFSRPNDEGVKQRFLEDLFIAKGSDGKWYFSTWHFCINMINLTQEGQPGSLEAFQLAYYAETFDGTAENCTKKTWPVDGEHEIRGGSSSGNKVFRAEVSGTTWKRVRILAFRKVYELDDKQLSQLKGFPPRNYSASGKSIQSYSLAGIVNINGTPFNRKLEIVVRRDVGVTIEKK